MEAFLSHLAMAGRVVPSTQNQALSALLFLCREVPQVELPWLDGVVRARRHKDVSTTMIYTHILNRGGRGVQSPFDCMEQR